MRVSVETPSYFFIFSSRYSVKLGRKNGGIHVFFGVRTWNLWWYSLKPWDFWWSWRPYTRLGSRAFCEFGPAGCLERPRFQWNHHRFQVLTPKNTWNPHFSSNFHWIPARKNKKIWRCFHWNPHLGIWRPNFGHEYPHTLCIYSVKYPWNSDGPSLFTSPYSIS